MRRLQQASWSRCCGVILTALLVGCGGKLYVVEAYDVAPLLERAVAQSREGVRVSAAVPGADETQAVFGLRLYDQGIQPVWLEITNDTGRRLRYAPVGTDREYYSALEVAYMNRSGYSGESLRAMEAHMLELAMPRYVEPGETVSGFVLTHLEPGTKGFNVDLFGDEFAVRFTYFLDVPGFAPDHSEVEFTELYAAEDLTHIARADLYSYLQQLPHATNGANVILIAPGESLLYASLRAGWQEMAASADRLGGDVLFDRPQDATFRYVGGEVDGYYELRIWLSPAVTDHAPIWLGQLRHIIDHRWVDPTEDPDKNNALFFLLQNLWYSETLLQHGWVRKPGAAAYEGEFDSDLISVLWLSSEPVELSAVEAVDWDLPEVR